MICSKLAQTVLVLIAAAVVGASADAPTASLAPWRHESDTVIANRGLSFTVPDVDGLTEFHGDAIDPKLSLYVGGNYFFVMAPLVKAFTRLHPYYEGRVYWETLPPGLLLDQIRSGGVVTCGNMTWKVPADIYFAGLEGVTKAIADGLLVAPAVPYVNNTLAIMVPAGNPANIRGLEDLGAPGLKLSMPNPAFEGVTSQIQTSLVKVGGQKVKDAVNGIKVKEGSTILTEIHHRQTPMFLMQGKAAAGGGWQSEVRYQEAQGHPIGHVDILAGHNTVGIYAERSSRRRRIRWRPMPGWPSSVHRKRWHLWALWLSGIPRWSRADLVNSPVSNVVDEVVTRFRASLEPAELENFNQLAFPGIIAGAAT